MKKTRVLISMLIVALLIMPLAACGSKVHIVYHLDGGKNHGKNHSSIPVNNGVYVLKSPSKYAYDFIGWFEGEGEEECQVEEISLKEARTVELRAKWERNQDFFGSFPVVDICTEEKKLPRDGVTYINSSFEISNAKDPSHNFSVPMSDAGGSAVGIRLRGNSTMGMPKKPYRIKFEDKHSVFGLEANKSWVLLADYIDQSSMRNFTAFNLAQRFDRLDFTPNATHVVLYINGEYQGVYLFCEHPDEKKGRSDVGDSMRPDKEDLTGEYDFNFQIEMDRAALGEGITGIDNFMVSIDGVNDARSLGFYPIEIKYPEAGDRGLDRIDPGLGDVVYDYIYEYMWAVFTTLYTGDAVNVGFRDEPVSFGDLVDIESFIDFYLVNLIMHSQDSVWGSVKMHKPKGGKLFWGPVWDFDWSMSNMWTGEPYNEKNTNIELSKGFYTMTHSLFSHFLKNEANYLKIQTRALEMREAITDTVQFAAEYRTQISEVVIKDAIFWYGETGALQFNTQYNHILAFLFERYFFFEKAFALDYNEFINTYVA